MYFLTGEYDHQIDAKNRIRIPSKLKGKEISLYFSKGTNGCIFVFYEEAMKEKIAEVEEKIKLADDEKQKGARKFLKSITLIEPDNQGRFVLPIYLKKHARITKDVKICGMGSRIEVWSKEVYDEYFGDDEKFDENFDADFRNLDI